MRQIFQTISPKFADEVFQDWDDFEQKLKSEKRPVLSLVELSGFIMENKSELICDRLLAFNSSFSQYSECEDFSLSFENSDDWRKKTDYFPNGIICSSFSKYIPFIHLYKYLCVIMYSNKVLSDRSFFDHDFFHQLKFGIPRLDYHCFYSKMFIHLLEKMFEKIHLTRFELKRQQFYFPIVSSENNNREAEISLYPTQTSLSNSYMSFYFLRSLSEKFFEHDLISYDHEISLTSDFFERIEYEWAFKTPFTGLTYCKRKKDDVKINMGTLNFFFDKFIIVCKLLNLPYPSFLFSRNRKSKLTIYALDGWFCQGKTKELKTFKYLMYNQVRNGYLIINECDDMWRANDNFMLKFHQPLLFYTFLYKIYMSIFNECDFNEKDEVKIFLDRGIVGFCAFQDDISYYTLFNLFFSCFFDEINYCHSVKRNFPFLYSSYERLYEQELYKGKDMQLEYKKFYNIFDDMVKRIKDKKYEIDSKKLKIKCKVSV